MLLRTCYTPSDRQTRETHRAAQPATASTRRGRQGPSTRPTPGRPTRSSAATPPPAARRRVGPPRADAPVARSATSRASSVPRDQVAAPPAHAGDKEPVGRAAGRRGRRRTSAAARASSGGSLCQPAKPRGRPGRLEAVGDLIQPARSSGDADSVALDECVLDRLEREHLHWFVGRGRQAPDQADALRHGGPIAHHDQVRRCDVHTRRTHSP
jgi:hypothetical protein